MAVIYLACPYSHVDPEVSRRRYVQVTHAAYRLMVQGWTVFSPITHSHPIEKITGTHQGWEFWEAQDLPILRKSDVLGILCLEGWQYSKGVKAELEEARRLALPVLFFSPTELLRPEELE